MKSQTLTNVLLLVIAVGTVGNLFQNQAERNPAVAQSPTRQSRYGDGAGGTVMTGPVVTIPIYVADSAIPVKIVASSMAPWEGVAMRPALSENEWRGLPSGQRVERTAEYVLHRYPSGTVGVDALARDIVDSAAKDGYLTTSEVSEVMRKLRRGER